MESSSPLDKSNYETTHYKQHVVIGLLSTDVCIFTSEIKIDADWSNRVSNQKKYIIFSIVLKRSIISQARSKVRK